MAESLPEEFVRQSAMNTLRSEPARGAGVQLLRKNAERFPESAQAHVSLGDALLAVGDTSGALVQLKKGVDAAAKAGDGLLMSTTTGRMKLIEAARRP